MVIDPSDPTLPPGVRAWLDDFERQCHQAELEANAVPIEMEPAPPGDILDATDLEFDIRVWDKLSDEGRDAPGL